MDIDEHVQKAMDYPRSYISYEGWAQRLSIRLKIEERNEKLEKRTENEKYK